MKKTNEKKKEEVKTVGTSSSQPSLAASEKPKQPKSPNIIDLRKRPAAKHKSLSSMERHTFSGNKIV